MAPKAGFEPATSRLNVGGSTIELQGLVVLFILESTNPEHSRDVARGHGTEAVGVYHYGGQPSVPYPTRSTPVFGQAVQSLLATCGDSNPSLPIL